MIREAYALLGIACTNSQTGRACWPSCLLPNLASCLLTCRATSRRMPLADDLDFEEQFLQIKHGKAGVPTAQDMKDAIWAFLTSDV